MFNNNYTVDDVKKIAQENNFLNDILFSPRKICGLTHPKCKWCKNPFCDSHGWKNRDRHMRKFGDLPAGFVPFSWGLYPGSYLEPPECSKVVKAVTAAFKDKYKRKTVYQYLWRWHWENNKPHLHGIVLLPIAKDIADSVRHSMISCADSVSYLYGQYRQVYLDRTRTWDAALPYIFQLDYPTLESGQCPRKYAYSDDLSKRFRIFGSSLAFPKKRKRLAITQH